MKSFNLKNLIAYNNKWLCIILCLISICDNLFSQIISDKYIKATEYIKDSIDLCTELRISKSKRLKNAEKIYLAGFKVSAEINFLNITQNTYQMLSKKENSLIDSFFINDSVFRKTFNFDTYKEKELSRLSTNLESVFILYFSKPIENLLMAEVVFCRSLWYNKKYKRKNYKGRKSYLNDIPVEESYKDNIYFRRGLQILFVFNNDKLIQTIKLPLPYK